MGSMIPEGSRVLVDTVALIYFLEENARYSKKAEEIFARIESGELQGSWPIWCSLNCWFRSIVPGIQRQQLACPTD